MCAKIRVNNKNNFIKIPIMLNFAQIGQSDVITEDFITVETVKSINPIVDYEKTRFSPINSNNEVIGDLIFNLNFLNSDGTSILPTTYYSDLGFIDDDIKYRKNRFTNSFLSLNFFDNDKVTNQNFISQISIFSKITYADTVDGLPKNVNELKTEFVVNNPKIRVDGFSEGFYLYHYKSDVTLGQAPPRYLYMRAEFNNAFTGKTTKFITSSDKLPVNELVDKLHVRYLLIRNTNGYFYKLDETYNNGSNIVDQGTVVTLNLYEIQVV